MTKPPWYGGNKIPDSYLKKFSLGPRQHEELPYELRVFLSRLDTRPVERHTDQYE